MEETTKILRCSFCHISSNIRKCIEIFGKTFCEVCWKSFQKKLKKGMANALEQNES